MPPPHALLMAAVASFPSPPFTTKKLARWVVPFVAGLTLLPVVSSGLALVLGVAVALTLGNPWPERSRALAHRALT
jgi:hypothetical protein